MPLLRIRLNQTLFHGSFHPDERRLPFALSAVGHAAAFALLMSVPEMHLPPPAQSEYKQAIEGKEDKIVWYRFNEKLPDIRPRTTAAQPKPLRAEARAKQEIVASPKKAPKREQLILMQAPELPDVKPPDAPNLLAIRFEPPAPPPPKLFTPPPPAPVDPPLEAKLNTDAPKLDLQSPRTSIPDIRQRIARKFIPPPASVKAKLADVTRAPEAPKLAVSMDLKPVELPLTTKAPGRTFTAPPARTAPAAKQVSVDLPPALASNAPSSANTLLTDARDLNLAIVGLKPAEKQTTLPSASSPGQFSAAPAIRRDGAEAVAGDARGIVVPDLFVRGAPGAKPDLIADAFAAPTSSSTLRQALRTASPRIANSADADAAPPANPPASATHAPAAVKVSGAPDPRFNGREVFMMAIQMPNITSYSGSWLMWYSARTSHEASLAPIAPPVARRVVDPKYIASAVSERVEGKIRLACVIDKGGRVAGIELVRGVDDRLNQSAEEALAKWEFTPATRQGEPVEVDVLVEIPFRLEPQTPVPF